MPAGSGVFSKGTAEIEEHLLALTRGNLQQLLNELFKLPSTASDVGAITTLPEPTTSIPRSMPVGRGEGGGETDGV